MKDTKSRKASFEMGQIIQTKTVATEMHPIVVMVALKRHSLCDWGDVPPEDKLSNEEALTFGGRLLSEFKLNSRRIWVITEANRSVTTVLFPEEY